ncbi:MAG: DUF4114 domain-containing protein [Pseudomonadota bacterium]
MAPTPVQGTLPNGLEEAAAHALPESRNVDAAFTNPAYEPYLKLSHDANVFVSFVNEGAGYRNSLGYYTFQNNTFDGLAKTSIDTDASGLVELSELGATDGVDMHWLFPNASKRGSGGDLRAGDTVELNGGSKLSAGTHVGFFLAQNAWDGSRVGLRESGTETQVFYSHDFLNPEAPAQATENDPELLTQTRHVAMLFADNLKSGLILAFEDLNRVDYRENAHWYRSDEDFNDAVFYITATPGTPMADTRAPDAITAPVPLPSAMVLQAAGAGVLIIAGWITRKRLRRLGLSQAG